MDEITALREQLAALRAENAELRKAEMRLDSVLQIAKIGSWELDLKARRSEWSKETRALLGVGPEAPPTPETVLSVALPEDRHIVRDALRGVAEGERRYDVTYRLRWSDGSIHTIHSVADAVTHEGTRATRLVGIVQDITEREALRAQLLQSQKMETVGRLAAGLAHDLNNMLTVIIGAADFIRLTVGDSEVLQDVEMIMEAVGHASGLTQGMLAYSRQQVLQPQPVEVNELLHNLRKMLARLLGEDISISVTVEEGIGRVFVDPAQLVQVLVNLALNARDAMPRGGELRFETSSDPSPDPRAPNGLARVRVQDTGEGMAPEVLARAFDPFFTTKETHRGTGLGLSTVQGIISQSGGWIDVESAPGQGTTFDIFLPITAVPGQQATQTARGRPEEPPGPGAGGG